MAQATITARVDEYDKAQFDVFCSNVGLNTSSAINMFVKAVLRENRIPFDIVYKPDPFYSETNLAYVEKSVQELRAGNGKAHSLIEVADEWNNLVWGRMGRLFKLATAGQKTLKQINEKDRLVYHMEDGRIYIAHCKGHYNDK